MDYVDSLVELFVKLGYENQATNFNDQKYVVLGGRFSQNGESFEPLAGEKFTVSKGSANEIILLIDDVPVVRIVVTDDKRRLSIPSNPASVLKTLKSDTGHTTAVFVVEPETQQWKWFPVGMKSPVLKSSLNFEDFASKLLTPFQLWEAAYMHLAVNGDDIFCIFDVALTATLKDEALYAIATSFVKTYSDMSSVKFIIKNRNFTGEHLEIISSGINSEDRIWLLEHKNVTKSIADKIMLYWNPELSPYNHYLILVTGITTVEQKMKALSAIKDKPLELTSVFTEEHNVENLAEAALRVGIAPKYVMDLGEIAPQFSLLNLFTSTGPVRLKAAKDFQTSFYYQNYSDIIDTLERILAKASIIAEEQFGVFPAEYLYQHIIDIAEEGKFFLRTQDVVSILDRDGCNS